MPPYLTKQQARAALTATSYADLEPATGIRPAQQLTAEDMASMSVNAVRAHYGLPPTDGGERRAGLPPPPCL